MQINNEKEVFQKRNKAIGLKPKDLIGIPWRVALALQQDGWYLRQDIIWHKPNPMPESVKDRCTKAHEYIFLLSKSPKYYFDNESIKEDAVGNSPNNKKPHKHQGQPFSRTKENLINIQAVKKSATKDQFGLLPLNHSKAHILQLFLWI